MREGAHLDAYPHADGPSTLDVPMTMKIETSVIKFSAAIPISAFRAALAAVNEK